MGGPVDKCRSLPITKSLGLRGSGPYQCPEVDRPGGRGSGGRFGLPGPARRGGRKRVYVRVFVGTGYYRRTTVRERGRTSRQKWVGGGRSRTRGGHRGSACSGRGGPHLSPPLVLRFVRDLLNLLSTRDCLRRPPRPLGPSGRVIQVRVYLVKGRSLEGLGGKGHPGRYRGPDGLRTVLPETCDRGGVG